MKMPLSRIAHTRSGDKGDIANIGVIAWQPQYYPILLREVTPDRVKEFFGEMVQGRVDRFELPNLVRPEPAAAPRPRRRRHRFPAHRRARQNPGRGAAGHGDRSR